MKRAPNSGWIEVITGSMFSGKTEELLRRLRRAEIAGADLTVFIPATDSRYGEQSIGSHAGRTWDAVPIEPAAVDTLPSHVPDDAVVAIDEANFFDTTLCTVCNNLADAGHRVIVVGTDQTYRGEPFSPLPELIAHAETVDKRTAVCTVCGDPATRNQRLINGEPAPRDSPTILVGDDDLYEARCRQCHTVPESGDDNPTR